MKNVQFDGSEEDTYNAGKDGAEKSLLPRILVPHFHDAFLLDDNEDDRQEYPEEERTYQATKDELAA